jgi:CRP-like cAMP-binding protein
MTNFSVRQLEDYAGLSDDLIEIMDANLTPQDFNVGESLLTQGQDNDYLYILIEGEIDVVVDGERVAEISTEGEFLGEMSALTGTSASATLNAKGLVKCQRLPGKVLDEFQKNSDHMAQVYGVYVRLLSKRLKNTNKKAMRFEKTMFELQEAKKTLEELNSKLESKVTKTSADLAANSAAMELTYVQLEEMIKSQGLAFSELKVLKEDSIPSLLSELKEIRRFLGGTSQDKFDEVIDKLNMTQDQLEPLVQMIDEDLEVAEYSIAIMQTSKKNLMLSKMALAGLGCSLETFSTVEDLKTFLQNNSCDLLVIDFEHADDAHSLNLKCPTIVVVDHDSSSVSECLTKTPDDVFFMSVPVGTRAFIVKSWQSIVRTVLSKKQPRFTSYLSKGAQFHKVDVSNSSQRENIIDRVNEYFAGFGIRKNFLARLSVVAEEMLMNAIYDAPVDENGKAKYNHLDRQVEVQLGQEEQARFFYGSDGSILAVGIWDPFGAFKRKDLIEHLVRCYSGNPEEADRGDKGGAGRGLHQMVEHSDLVTFTVLNGISTQVFAFFHLDPLKEDYGPRLQLIFQ